MPLSTELIIQLAQKPLSDMHHDVGLLAVMGGHGATSGLPLNVPQASEAISLLLHYAPKLSITEGLNAVSLDVAGIYAALPGLDRPGRLLLCLTAGEGELQYIAHWLTDSLRSSRLKTLPALLAIPFNLVLIDGRLALIPDWCIAIYPFRNPEHCFPLLTQNGMIKEGHVPEDWIETALHRLGSFGLPVERALKNLEDERTINSAHNGSH